MKRLTAEEPQDNFETMMNYVYSKDGWAYIRHDGVHEDVPLTQWARRQCAARGCADEDLPGDTPEEIDEALCGCMMDCPDCPIALAYCFASQAVHLRDRLKRYEDTGLDPETVNDLLERFHSLYYMVDDLDLIDRVHFQAFLERVRRWTQAKKVGRLAGLPPNDPLTLEELREMDGEPVWLHTFSAVQKKTQISCWAILECSSGANAVFLRAGVNSRLTKWFCNYGERWLAYSRKPEGGSA